MKTVVTGVISTLMLLGMLSATAVPKQTQATTQVMAGSAPMPMCYPGDPGCGPVIPLR
jgi:hypothetical protein